MISDRLCGRAKLRIAQGELHAKEIQVELDCLGRFVDDDHGRLVDIEHTSRGAQESRQP